MKTYRVTTTQGPEFVEATTFSIDPRGYLALYRVDRKNESQPALFAPGAWMSCVEVAENQAK